MRVVDVDLANLLTRAAFSESSKACYFVVQCAWDNSREYRQRLVDGMRKAESQGITVLQAVTCYGGDEVEDFLFERLPKSFTSFPAFIHVKTKSAHDSSVDSEKATGLFYEVLVSANEGGFESLKDFGVLFVGGDRSSVGKTSCCLGILASLVHGGYFQPSELGYVKPVTQCEAEQPIINFCAKQGIECRGIGPVVFYKGFTRAFLEGETPSSEALIAEAVAAVKDIKSRRKLVLVDGVGYPAVGSICGVSNAHVAAGLQAPVLLIGKSGVGDAVDSHNLNSIYFEHHGVRVLGTILNKISLDGYYALSHVQSSVDQYFRQYRSDQKVYGYLPAMELPDREELDGHGAMKLAVQLCHAFSADPAKGHGGVDVKQLLEDVLLHHQGITGGLEVGMYIGRVLNTSRRAPFGRADANRVATCARDIARHSPRSSFSSPRSPRKRSAQFMTENEGQVSLTSAQVHPLGHDIDIVPNGPANGDGSGAGATKKSKPGKSRAEIEAEAKSKGASGG